MDAQIASTEVVDRVSPITDNPYLRSPPGTATPWETLLTTASARPPSRAERLGRGRFATSIPRLLWLHRSAIEAEQAARFEAADFWWNAFSQQFDRIDRSEQREELLRDTFAGGASPPAEPWKWLIVDRFISVHLGFFRAFSATGEVGAGRAKWHRDRFDALVVHSALSPAERLDLRLQLELAELGGAKQLQAVAVRLKALRTQFGENVASPARLRDWLVGVERSHAQAKSFEVACDWNQLLGDWGLSGPDDSARAKWYLEQSIEASLTTGRYRDAAKTSERLAKTFRAARTVGADTDAIHRRAIRTHLTTLEWGEIDWHLNECLGNKNIPGTPPHGRKLGVLRHFLVAAHQRNQIATVQAVLPRLETLAQDEERDELLTYSADFTLRQIEAKNTLCTPEEWGRLLTLAKAASSNWKLHARFILALAKWTKAALDRCPKSSDDAVNARFQIPTRQKITALAESACEAIPSCMEAFHFAAQSHAGLAVQQALAREFSEALLSIEKSIAYLPGDQDNLQIRNQLNQVMGNVIQQSRQLQAQLTPRFQIGYVETRTLTQAGRELVDQATKGTAARDRFRQNGYDPIAEASARARLLHLWLRAGLPAQSSTAKWEKKAKRFDAATDRLLAKNPQTGADLLLGWLDLTQSDPDLVTSLPEIGPEALIRLFTKDEADAPTPNPIEAIRARTKPDDLVWLDAPSEYADAKSPVPPEPTPSAAHVAPLPSLLVAGFVGPAGPVSGGKVPFEFWLFSRRDWLAKTVVALGLPFVIVFAILFAQDRERQRQRDVAYLDLRVAIRSQDFAAARGAIDRFRAVAIQFPTAGTRTQERNVHDLDRILESRSVRDREYELFTASLKSSDVAAMLTAANEFLASLPKPAELPEGRTATLVAQTRSRVAVFVRDSDRDPSEQETALIKRFQQLVSNTK